MGSVQRSTYDVVNGKYWVRGVRGRERVGQSRPSSQTLAPTIRGLGGGGGRWVHHPPHHPRTKQRPSWVLLGIHQVTSIGTYKVIYKGNHEGNGSGCWRVT